MSEHGLRLITDAPAPGPWNMAVDEALLLGGGGPTLRCYSWSPPTVSLGYFQSHADFADLPPSTPIVRRITGGGAIHHADELTFALTIEAGRLPADIAASYRLLHDAAALALAAAGVPCWRKTTSAPSGPRPKDRWCFADAGRDDVVTEAGKLLGAAQRRLRTPLPRVLHHGSIVLQRPALTPFVAATADVVANDATFRTRLQTLLAEHFGMALDLDLRHGDLAEAERTLAAQLCAARYGDAEFVQRR